MFFLNLGDSRAGSGRGPSGKNSTIKNQETRQGFVGSQQKIPEGFKRKDIFGIPFRAGIALQESGWYWRDCIPWVKYNGMPGSYKDRPVSTIEWILILTKTDRNYYDYVGVMQQASDSYLKDKRPGGILRQRVNPNTKYNRDESQFKKETISENGSCNKRLLRSSDFFFQSFQGMWLNEEFDPLALILNTKSFGEKHYASFPPSLPEVCIRASTSEYVCSKCGAPYTRLTKKGEFINQSWGGEHIKAQQAVGGVGATSCFKSGGTYEIITTGWEPSCSCDTDKESAICVDFFSGSAATGVACKRTSRNYIGIELNPDYVKMGYKRIEGGK